MCVSVWGWGWGGVGCARVWCSVVCMRVCARACVCVCARVCACVSWCVCVRTYMRVCVRACVHARVCVRVRACVRACVGVSLLVNLAAMSHSKLCRSTHGYCTYMQSPHTRVSNRNLGGTYSTLERQRMHTIACFIFRQVKRARGYVGKSIFLTACAILRNRQRSSTDRVVS